MLKDRELEPHQNFIIETIVGKEPSEYSELLNQISSHYITVFGNDPFNEGAVSENGSTISLNEYITHVIASDAFQKVIDFEVMGIEPKTEYSTQELTKILSWTNRLTDTRKDGLVEEVKMMSGGYKPYYTHDGVLSRFSHDLDPSNGLTPILSYWKDTEYDICGFLTGVVVGDEQSFFKIVDNTPYLVSGHPDIKIQIGEFLKSVSDFTFPLLLEHEGAVIPERRGRNNGSRWPEIFYNVRKEALVRGVKYSSGFTSKNSPYYKNATKFGLLTHEYTTKPTTGDSMQFFLSEIE